MLMIIASIVGAWISAMLIAVGAWCAARELFAHRRRRQQRQQPLATVTRLADHRRNAA